MYRDLLSAGVFLFSTILIINFNHKSQAGKSRQSLLDVPRFKSVTCQFAEEMHELMYPNTTCKVNKIDRRTTTITVYVLLKEPINSMSVRIF